MLRCARCVMTSLALLGSWVLALMTTNSLDWTMRQMWGTVHAHLQKLPNVANQDMADVLLNTVVPYNEGMSISLTAGR